MAGANGGNGGTLARGGGTYPIRGLLLQRSSHFSFRSGNTINGSYTMGRLYNSWPDIEARQDLRLYAYAADMGLSFDDASDAISLGYTGTSDTAESTLYWDAGLQGVIDWTLRWRGNHAVALRND
ncbi:MAG: hypothetical protein ACJAZO_003040 [Myxococcota bacterium]